ncbi:hypothetical protein MPSEU_000414600 [Mayamaea pseudoterrestris]|nr:hypothetical protein MPSEU_000414600 [Mayamaea pseudoterrestris]
MAPKLQDSNSGSTSPTSSPTSSSSSMLDDGDVSDKSNKMNDDATPQEPSCEKLYGPYPRAIPTPFVSNIRNEGREGDVATAPSTDESKTDMDSILQQLPPDARDDKTPDAWVKRDGRLVRLTGKHPFNCEPPLAIHHQYQFITPSSLHYVRNHGACPQLEWDKHEIQVGGTCVHHSLTLKMDDLVKQFDPREFPVTLVCAGNRRKEQNMMRQTIGFNWGPAGVSTNVWKGVLLRDVLLRAGVDASNAHLKHVEFIGTEDLPNKVGPGPFEDEQWGKQVKYGTSIPLARAMNPAYDVLIAYEANGQKLQPDHGFPVRLIIPGYIGGRMIKWLAKINVIEHETHNMYHYNDNRILPPHVTAEEASKNDWFYKPEYIFNELNINSAMSKPDHNETLSLAKNIKNTFPVTGYAYSGGGRKITRVEVSTDGGRNWDLAKLNVKERPTPHGMQWCWVWWTYDLPVADLVGAKEIWCRAWDESNNTQPHQPTWNLMGMGNNQIFRVKVHLEKNDSGDFEFRFEHPTQPGQQTGGWMTRISDKPESAGYGKILDEVEVGSKEDEEPAKKENGKTFSLQEVRKHNTEKDCWIIVKDRVYDATEYLDMHPGGMEAITINAGEDATEDFVAIHSMKAHKMLEKYYIGDLDKDKKGDGKEEETPPEEEQVDEQGHKIALNPRKKTPFKLQHKEVLSRDTILLNFALPTPEHVLGLPTGKHMFLSANIDGETVIRRYTPISSNHDLGCVKFVIKVYHPCDRFPKGGKMSQYVDTLKVGDSLNMRGPVGEFEYTKNGNFKIDNEPEKAKCFNMVAGGTGITPIMQIASEILRHEDDPTKMSLIFAARIEEELLMRSTLDEWASKYPEKFKVHYILSEDHPKDWKYSTGFVDKQLFQEHLFEPAKGVHNLLCGPPIMLEKGVTPALQTLGHDKKSIFAF